MATPVRVPLLVIPWVWAIVGGSAAVLLDALPDFALIAAAAIVLLLELRRLERPAK